MASMAAIRRSCGRSTTKAKSLSGMFTVTSGFTWTIPNRASPHRRHRAVVPRPAAKRKRRRCGLIAGPNSNPPRPGSGSPCATGPKARCTWISSIVECGCGMTGTPKNRQRVRGLLTTPGGETLGEVSGFETLGELIEAIHQIVYYYNHKRKHTTLNEESGRI